MKMKRRRRIGSIANIQTPASVTHPAMAPNTEPRPSTERSQQRDKAHGEHNNPDHPLEDQAAVTRRGTPHRRRKSCAGGAVLTSTLPRPRQIPKPTPIHICGAGKAEEPDPHARADHNVTSPATEQRSRGQSDEEDHEADRPPELAPAQRGLHQVLTPVGGIGAGGLLGKFLSRRKAAAQRRPDIREQPVERHGDLEMDRLGRIPGRQRQVAMAAVTADPVGCVRAAARRDEAAL